jgi:REP element-mobilizing transposase RayT
VKILDEVRRRHAFRLIGYVVMPEHVHPVMSEPANKNPSKILQVLKQKVVRALLKKRRRMSTQMLLPFDGSRMEEAHFWQRGWVTLLIRVLFLTAAHASSIPSS